MSAKVLLRIAAVAVTLFDLGHTLGGMVFAKSRGAEEELLLAALKSYRFEVMGSMRSHYDFYTGEGWYLAAVLTTLIVTCWLLSNATTTSPALVRQLSLVIAVFFGVSVALSAAFFFIAPLVTSAIAATACAAAYWNLRGA